MLGLGLVVLVTALGTAAVALCYRRAPHRLSGARPATARSPSLARRAEAAGVPVAAVAGVRFALEPGTGRTAVPVRSALVGTVIAVAMVVATLTFASSLHTLVSHPPLYGWNWDYALDPTNNVPPTALRLLGHDPDVDAWSGWDYNNVEIDDQGRQLWDLFAHNLNAVPDPTVPALSVVLVAVGAFVFANLVAALPGRGAARTPTALVLRAE